MKEDFATQIEETCRRIKPVDQAWIDKAAAKQLTLTKPPGSLGRLEEIGNRVIAIYETISPSLASKRIYVVAADHGVSAEGVSAYPREVTRQMVLNFLGGGAAINVLARHGNIDIKVVDAGVDGELSSNERLIHKKVMSGTANIALGPAMTREQAENCVAIGIELARTAKRENVALLGIGDMGIGNTTAASAITATLSGCLPHEVTGRGTGIDDSKFGRKVEIIQRAIELNRPNKNDAIDVLAKVGGAEIGVMMGVLLGAAAERLPLVADGFISTAGAALAVAHCSLARDYVFIGHFSQEPGHRALIDYIGLKPILDLEMRLGEGTGAALAMHIIDGSARLLAEMATFDEAGVSNRQS